MPDSFGARMRERREQQHVTLSTIAEQTKIKISLLEALERDDVSHWPSGIFRRAFIRAYAQAIGLEPDVVVREFLDLHPDPGEIIAAVDPDDGQHGWRSGDGAPARFRDLVASAIGSVSRLRGRNAATAYPTLQVNAPTEPALAPPPAVERPREIAPLIPEPASFVDTPAEAEPAAPIAAAAELPNMIERIPELAAQQSEPGDKPAVGEADLLAMAHLCTELGRVETTGKVVELLERASSVLDAVGVILWVWDPIANELGPVLAHGYSDQVLAQLPRVDRGGNNATAAAFREEETCIVHSTEHVSGALAVPLLTPTGCAGVLAMELNDRREEQPAVRALATILAAQLAGLLGAAHPSQAADRRLA